MSSGKVVVNRERKDEPPGFHIYSGSAEDWRKLKQLPGLCQHGVWDMVPVTTGNQELLAVSCWDCKVIRLLNLETGESSTAFRDPWYTPQFLCEGEEGQMFVRCWGNKILQLNCSSQTFDVVKSVKLEKSCSAYGCSIRHVPRHKLVVTVGDREVRGYDSESGKLRWEKPKASIKTNTIVYSPEHDVVLFLCWKNLSVIYVLNASDGELRQELRLPGVYDVWDMKLHDGQLVLLHSYGESEVSFFSLQ